MKNRKKKSKPKKIRQSGLPPETPVFIGEQKMVNPLVTLMQFNENQCFEKHSEAGLPEAESGDFITWYDVKGLHDVTLIQQLGEKYQIHPLVLEDILDTQQRPKFEEYNDGIFITLHAILFDTEQQEVNTEHIAVYAGPNFVLSFQEKDDDTLEPIRQRIKSETGKIRQRGSDYLAYSLADSVVDNYFIILDQVQEAIEVLEEEILNHATNQSKGRIHHLKVQMLTLRKSVLPLREAVNWFTKAECPIVQPGTHVFTRDLYDHIVQVMEMIENYRDILNGLYDLYSSELNYYTNNIIRTLTILSTIFMPLTFLVGVYGMNFDFMPELRWRWGYPMVWGVMILVVIFMLVYFRRKKWI